jgi:hypothetical protein
MGGCLHNLKANTCLFKIKGISSCFKANENNPSNSCQYCNPSKSQSFWTTVNGTAIHEYNFDNGSLGGWTITPNPATSAVKWQLDKKRSSSAPYSLYFGNVANHTYNDPGKTVSGDVISPEISLPTGKGKLCLEFQLFQWTEATGLFDQLTINALPSEELLWKSGVEVNYADTAKTFRTFSVDVSAFAGQTIQFKFNFNSGDAQLNSTEGVYLDNIKVLTGCGL